MAVILVYGHRYYGRVDRVAGQFHFVTLFFHFSYLPLYPLQTCLIREGAGACYGSGASVGLRLKSVLVGYLRGWLSKFSGFLAFAGGLLCGVVFGLAFFPLSRSAGVVLAILFAVALGFAHLYVLTERPRRGRHPAAERLFWQIGLTGLTLVVGAVQLVIGEAAAGLVNVKAALPLHVLPVVAIALMAAAEVLGYGYRLTLLLTPAGYEQAQNLIAEFG